MDEELASANQRIDDMSFKNLTARAAAAMKSKPAGTAAKDNESEAHPRHLCSGPDPSLNVPALKMTPQRTRDDEPIRAAENEGMPSRSESRSPLRTRNVAGHI